MAAFCAPRVAVFLVIFTFGAMAQAEPLGSEEAVDRTTQTALALDVHPDRGSLRFAHDCARCHGTGGEGNADRAIPALAGQRFAYLVRQLANFAGAERDSDAMHRVISQPGLRGPQAWVDLAAYLNRLPPSRGGQTGDGRRVALGRGIYREQCASCHRGDAHGDSDGFVPSLRNQQFSYLVSQLHKLGKGNRHNVDKDLVRFLDSFDDQDIDATADYLSRLHGPGAVRRIMRDDGVVVD